MSLSLRLGGSLPFVNQTLLGWLPRLTVGLNLPGLSSLGRDSLSQDKRLKELKEQIENNNGQPPFMVDNGTILRAAPKKKMSKRRHRTKLYTPGDKQVQPLNNLVRCPACGNVKRSHFMCMYCFAEIKAFLKGKKRENGLIKDVENPQTNLDPVDERILYPGKFIQEDERQLKKKDWIPVREEPLAYNSKQVKHVKN
ncbi:mitochondrial ribosomal large subunit protein [Scheffersomyces xylosifermentans]|uniref:mitochondrial ribosomal large subunit protein n=1 Tax=Scheffersomyces xylosifermentans TaxID=1304137 RepID=UPI00315C7668